MERDIYRYEFRPEAVTEDLESSLVLALLACEALHGEANVRLDAAYHWDREARVCVLDASTAVGRDLARLFTGLVRREYGEDSFAVRRVGAEGPTVSQC